MDENKLEDEDRRDPTDYHQGPMNMAMFRGSQPTLMHAATCPDAAPSMHSPSVLPPTQIGPHPRSRWGEGRSGPGKTPPPPPPAESLDLQTTQLPVKSGARFPSPLPPVYVPGRYGSRS